MFKICLVFSIYKSKVDTVKMFCMQYFYYLLCIYIYIYIYNFHIYQFDGQFALVILNTPLFNLRYRVVCIGQCTELLKQKKGVCLDEEVSGIQDYQMMGDSRHDGVSVFTYRRRLVTGARGVFVTL